MSGNEIHQILNSVGVGIGLIGIIWLAAVKMTRLEVKVDTLWGMLMKRAVVEGVGLKLMEVHSPVRLINNSGDMLIHMSDSLRTFYKEQCQGLSEKEAALAIEKQFGSQLATEICIPNNISFGVCIIIALAVAKDVESLTEILDQNLPADFTPANQKKEAKE